MTSYVMYFLQDDFYTKIEKLTNKYWEYKTRFFYRKYLLECGKKTIIKSPLMLTPKYIRLGNDVVILNDCRIQAVEKYQKTDYLPEIIIEDNVSIQQRSHITAASTLIIGKKTTILFDVLITDIDHSYQEIGVQVDKQPLIIKKTRIGENCFIGSGAKIQAGTILGRHCVVGANAVVRGIFPDYSVIVGVPAKIVKRYDAQSGIWRKTNDKGEFYEEI